MDALNGRLLDLVRKLDVVGPSPSLVDLAQAMESTRLSLADVAPFVRPDIKGYHRSPVVVREQYEVLVMTWLPGQASVPHDHSGSICVMQVVQGEAVEGSYRVGADGYVDLEYETTVGAGEITAGQDAGVHTVRNSQSDGPPMVTVHVYAPPLRDFRRFVPRPKPLRDEAPVSIEAVPTIVIVGGGFSGSVTAAQLLRQAKAAGTKLRIVITERRGAIGEGLAYSTREPSHLLNVPAGRMSAWPDRPDDFVNWASRRYREVQPGEFLPRQWYGEYVRELMLSAARDAVGVAELNVVLDEVRRVARHPGGGWMVHMARGASVRAETVVLAVGHRPPSDPIAARWSGPRHRFIADPWRPLALNVVGQHEPVVVLGSGLSAVDAVLSLVQQSHQAPITLLSRRGLAPQAHAATALAPVDMQAFVTAQKATPEGVRALPLFRELLKTVREQTRVGGDWRAVLDGLRPHTAALWQAMPLAERRRFLGRLRPFWEVHRHRMALAVAKQFNELVERGKVRVLAGRILSSQAQENGVTLVVAQRGSDRWCELRPSWILNCTGPAPSNSAVANPVIGSLLVHGWLKPDPLNLGVETSETGHAMDAEGHEVPDLFVIGTLRKPAYWESTAVPELRGQAAAIATGALAQLAQGRSPQGIGAPHMRAPSPIRAQGDATPQHPPRG